MSVEVMNEPALVERMPLIPRGVALPRLINRIQDWLNGPSGRGFDFVVGSRIEVEGIETKSPVKTNISGFNSLAISTARLMKSRCVNGLW